MKALLKFIRDAVVGFFASLNLFSTLFFNEEKWEDKFDPSKQLGLKIKHVFSIIKRIGVGIMAIITLPLVIVFAKIIFCRRKKVIEDKNYQKDSLE
ncbi:MAG: hypothetical protein Q7S18_00440 [bacterium]|nr:hypothetical protein [bacterium]